MKKYKLRMWVKVVITLTLISLGIILYHYLGVLGAYTNETILTKVFVLLGWIWLLIGQIIVLYVLWES